MSRTSPKSKRSWRTLLRERRHFRPRTRDPDFLAVQTLLFNHHRSLCFPVWNRPPFFLLEESNQRIVTLHITPMAFIENSRQSLVPSFLYTTPVSKKLFDVDTLVRGNPTLPTASSNGGASKSFMIPAPSEPGKIAMFSPAYYAACTVGGTLCCGLTHMAVTPLDLVKCNMQVCFRFSFRLIFIYVSLFIDHDFDLVSFGLMFETADVGFVVFFTIFLSSRLVCLWPDVSIFFNPWKMLSDW